MGEVFLAELEDIGRRVAVKVLPHTYSEDPARVMRFRREVHALGQLSHPNICPIIDVGVEHGVPYYAMEYLAGCDLAEVIQTQLTFSSGKTEDSFWVHSASALRRSIPSGWPTWTLMALTN